MKSLVFVIPVKWNYGFNDLFYEAQQIRTQKVKKQQALFDRL